MGWGRTVTRACLFTWVCCAALSVEAPAHALQDYAMEIRAELGLSEQPSCLYCHARNERGLAVDTPFGDALKARGFSRRLGLPALRTALARLDEMNIDSDGDAVGDVDELRAGANPNDVRDAGLPPADGCSVVQSKPLPTLGWLLTSVFLVWFRQRRT